MLYGCEAWSLTLREECRLRVFEKRILRRVFGPTWDENGERRRFHNDELHSLYSSPNIVRVIKFRSFRWAGHVAKMEEGRSALKTLTGKPTGKRIRKIDSIKLLVYAFPQINLHLNRICFSRDYASYNIYEGGLKNFRPSLQATRYSGQVAVG